MKNTALKVFNAIPQTAKTKVAVKAKTNKVSKQVLEQRALKLIKRHKNFEIQKAVIEQDKSWFREQAEGSTLNVPVAGFGQVQVKKGSSASSGTSLVFNEEAYNLLDATTKAKLIKLAVITAVPYSKAEGTPSVTVTVNK